MGKGKLAVQVAHASLTAALEAREKHPTWFEEWMREGQRKIVLKVASQAELESLFRQARELGLPTALICDAGLTQLPPGTVCLLYTSPSPRDISGSRMPSSA